ncbi:hypothetical protein BDN72DRAFT_168183 [Pluteus cervinus]|uniref:Uncharacterized protein n=1 Tax=Pluteus cervinus TaxID=181527 RepID=A0ACD3B6T7_9AGAR|nr:hypothetical protein BDN72DRAFT_168183 [Pluteus cervinus]
MASSFARNVLGVASRASMRSSSASAMRSVSRSVMRRGMSSTSHGHGHSAPSSDKAWIIASALVFGPATLYILSPSGKTHNTGHHGHEDNHASSHSTTKGEEVKHEPPAAAAEAVKEESDAAPVLVKDDEGKVEDVKESLKAAETDDVPKADPSANEQHVAETGKPLFNTDVCPPLQLPSHLPAFTYITFLDPPLTVGNCNPRC